MFGKVFQSLWSGSLCGKSDQQLVFIFMLANATSEGVCDVFHDAIAASTGIPPDRVRAAALELEAPDSSSRTAAEGGRRIVRLDEHRTWGWLIVNYAKYRAIKDAETVRESTRERVRRYRAKHSGGSPVPSHEPALSDSSPTQEVGTVPEKSAPRRPRVSSAPVRTITPEQVQAAATRFGLALEAVQLIADRIVLEFDARGYKSAPSALLNWCDREAQRATPAATPSNACYICGFHPLEQGESIATGMCGSCRINQVIR
jgi:hypothetical protein